MHDKVDSSKGYDLLFIFNGLSRVAVGKLLKDFLCSIALTSLHLEIASGTLTMPKEKQASR